jgi:hypothetical protein
VRTMVPARYEARGVHGAIRSRDLRPLRSGAVRLAERPAFLRCDLPRRWHARERRRAEAAVWLDDLTEVLTRPGATAFAELVRSSREAVRP